jgi:hypothetical protein
MAKMSIKDREDADWALYNAHLRGECDLPESWTTPRPAFDIWMYVDKETGELKTNLSFPEDNPYEGGGSNDTSTSRKTNGPTDPQLDKIAGYRDRLPEGHPLLDVVVADLTKKTASTYIDRLKDALPDSATPGQLDYLRKLVDARDTTSLGLDFDLLLAGHIGPDAASKMIDALKLCPFKPAPVEVTDDEWNTLAGELADLGGQHGARFAVDTEDGADNELAFWVVVRRGARIYLNQYIGGSGPVRVRMTRPAQLAVVKKIHAAGAHAAMIRFGHELGYCGRCGTELTDDASRAAGIGPICAGK